MKFSCHRCIKTEQCYFREFKQVVHVYSSIQSNIIFASRARQHVRFIQRAGSIPAGRGTEILSTVKKNTTSDLLKYFLWLLFQSGEWSKQTFIYSDRRHVMIQSLMLRTLRGELLNCTCLFLCSSEINPPGVQTGGVKVEADDPSGSVRLKGASAADEPEETGRR